MKTKLVILWTAVIGLLILPMLALAQDASTLPPLPGKTVDYWKYGIAVIVPILVQGMKWLAPKIPKMLLPISTPFIGLLLGAGLKALGATHMDWVDMCEAGAMAVMIRESWNQIAKQFSQPPALN